MTPSSRFLTPAEAARRLGVSSKALRLYEQRGLIAPGRTAAGWRAYGPDEMARAGEIAALRALGLSLADVARVLRGDAEALEPARLEPARLEPARLEPARLELTLASHQAVLEGQLRDLVGTIEKLRGLRADLAGGRKPAAGELTRLLRPESGLTVAFALPWPWGGEQFELTDIRRLTYIIGPLGSGKTRLAMRLAEMLPNAAFLGLDRLAGDGAAARARLEADAALKGRVDRTLAWLIDDGATPSGALIALVTGLIADGPAILVVDMVEQGLDQASQEAVIAYLRQPQAAGGRPLFLMTRSSAILDPAALGADEAIILCPANHSPPSRVAPYPGTPGYEAVATCLAMPDVRARTAGTVAWRPPQGNVTA